MSSRNASGRLKAAPTFFRAPRRRCEPAGLQWESSGSDGTIRISIICRTSFARLAGATLLGPRQLQMWVCEHKMRMTTAGQAGSASCASHTGLLEAADVLGRDDDVVEQHRAAEPGRIV